MMRIPIWLTIFAALASVVVVLVVGLALVQPDVPLITAAGFAFDTITPNADGDADVVTFSYTLSRNALVSLFLVADDGTEYVFRDQQRRTPQDYQVDFSGVVEGYILPGEDIAGDVLRRLIPDGRYTWRLTAVGQEREETDQREGTLIVQNADSPLPEITIFDVSLAVFTPNQDGIDDRAAINVYLEKDADLTVYLVDEEGQRYYISERQEDRKLGEAGRHFFDYDGGVDQGADPPPDGSYTVVVVAQDAVGQVVQRTASLTIQNGGKPLAEIVPQVVGVDVVFDAQSYADRFFSSVDQLGDIIAPPDDPSALALTTVSVPLGDVLVFKLTVENYSDVPIRTSGPPPGTVYQQDQNAATLGEYDQSGAWRVGIHCETAKIDFPWRWAIGTSDNLVTEEDPSTGNIYYYLPPGERSVVWGGVRMTNLVERRNPQACWAGLIHEDVEVSVRNNNVGRRQIELIDPKLESVDN